MQHNKPDLVVHDKKNNKITIIEIGITNKDRLKTVETEKYRKYDLLKKELRMMHKCEVEVIPYVMTWDGITTKCHKKYRKRLEIDRYVEAYIQSLTIKKTVESITLEMWSTDAGSVASREERIDAAIEVVYKADKVADDRYRIIKDNTLNTLNKFFSTPTIGKTYCKYKIIIIIFFFVRSNLNEIKR